MASAAAISASACCTRPPESVSDCAVLQLVLAQLLVEDGNLIARRLGLCFDRLEPRTSLVFARSHLLIVENGDDVAGLHAITVADADLEDASPGLWRDRGVVSLDAPAQGHDGVRNARADEEEAPSRVDLSSALTVGCGKVPTAAEFYHGP
jgi:hypothetical protein